MTVHIRPPALSSIPPPPLALPFADEDMMTQRQCMPEHDDSGPYDHLMSTPCLLDEMSAVEGHKAERRG